jgi:hypothetical protein
MARILFNPNSPIKRLSGRYGNIVYQFRYGKQFLYGAAEPVLPPHPTPEQRRLFRRQSIVEQCVNILQTQLELSQQAIDARKTIKNRITYLYNRYNPGIKAPTKLQKKIMTEYYANHPLTDLGLPLKSFSDNIGVKCRSSPV